MLRKRLRTGKAASLVEYALLASLIAVVCIIAVRAVGVRARCRFQSIETAMRTPSVPVIFATACSSGGSGGSGATGGGGTGGGGAGGSGASGGTGGSGASGGSGGSGGGSGGAGGG